MTHLSTTLLRGKVRLLQPTGQAFRAGLDTVMLAAACPVRDGQNVLDLGTGVGGAALCLWARVPTCFIVGVEIDPILASLAARNGVLNRASSAFVCADVVHFAVSHRFDHVICNPPYLEAGQYMPCPDPVRARAMGHVREGLEAWVLAALRLLKPKGTLTLIHRADSLNRVLSALNRRFGDVEVIPLWPRAGQAARRVIVRARKGHHGPMTLHAGLVLHEREGGSYTPAARAVLEDTTELYFSSLGGTVENISTDDRSKSPADFKSCKSGKSSKDDKPK